MGMNTFRNMASGIAGLMQAIYDAYFGEYWYIANAFLAAGIVSTVWGELHHYDLLVVFMIPVVIQMQEL